MPYLMLVYYTALSMDIHHPFKWLYVEKWPTHMLTDLHMFRNRNLTWNIENAVYYIH